MPPWTPGKILLWPPPDCHCHPQWDVHWVISFVILFSTPNSNLITEPSWLVLTRSYQPATWLEVRSLLSPLSRFPSPPNAWNPASCAVPTPSVLPGWNTGVFLAWGELLEIKPRPSPIRGKHSATDLTSKLSFHFLRQILTCPGHPGIPGGAKAVHFLHSSASASQAAGIPGSRSSCCTVFTFPSIWPGYTLNSWRQQTCLSLNPKMFPAWRSHSYLQ